MDVAAIASSELIQISPGVPLDRVLAVMEEHDFRHIPVVDAGRVVGVVSEHDLLEATGGAFDSERLPLDGPILRASDVMSAPPIVAAPDESLVAVAQRFVERGVGCLPVVRDGELVSIVSEFDLLAAYRDRVRIGAIALAEDPPASVLATARPLVVAADDAAEFAFETMQANGFRHLPVRQAGRLVGMVSHRDLLRAVGRGDLEAIAVENCMSERPFSAKAHTPLSTCVTLMVDMRFSCLPLIEEDDLVAILTVRDVLGPCARALDVLE